MNIEYINIYNNFINLTTNKTLYKGLKKPDIFSDRLLIFLVHFAFFLNNFKSEENSEILQKIYDFNFRQMELSIREIGYGDQSINKRMKNYLNLFYLMIEKIDNWENLSSEEKIDLLANFLNENADNAYLANYFEKYRQNLLNNTLNSYIKGVVTQ